MADIIIVAILAVAVFFILRSQFRKVRQGQCVGGCAGCSGCSGCAKCSGGGNGGGHGMEKAEENGLKAETSGGN